MHVDRVQNVAQWPSAADAPGGDVEEAAAEFERILVKQFVSTMTESLFNDSLAGDDGPSWMGAYGDMQRDALSDALTDHLVESGTMRLRDLLLRQWSHREAAARAEELESES